jgi:uncharacterized protein (DUF433 family)
MDSRLSGNDEPYGAGERTCFRTTKYMANPPRWKEIYFRSRIVSGSSDADWNVEDMLMLDRIIADPKICHGQACVKGTRIPVFVILEALASGMPIDRIIEDYPPLSEKDIRACVYYASIVTREEEVPLGV